MYAVTDAVNAGHLMGRQVPRRRHGGVEGVDLAAVFPESVAEVGAGGHAGGAHSADDLALFDVFPFADAFGETGEVEILGGIRTGVADLDVIAVGCGRSPPPRRCRRRCS
jgi:hypothetical protein